MSDDADARADPARRRLPRESHWVRAPGMLWRNAGTTVVLLPRGPGSPTPLVVSGSGALVWELLATPTSLGELATRIAAIYDANEEMITADLEPILGHLHSARALVRI